MASKTRTAKAPNADQLLRMAGKTRTRKASKTRTAKAPNADQQLRVALISIIAFFVLILGAFFVAQAMNSTFLLTGAIFTVAGLSVILSVLGASLGIWLAKQESNSEASRSEGYHFTPSQVVHSPWKVVTHGSRVPEDVMVNPDKAAREARRQRKIMGRQLSKQTTVVTLPGKTKRSKNKR